MKSMPPMISEICLQDLLNNTGKEINIDGGIEDIASNVCSQSILMLPSTVCKIEKRFLVPKVLVQLETLGSLIVDDTLGKAPHFFFLIH